MDLYQTKSKLSLEVKITEVDSHLEDYNQAVLMYLSCLKKTNADSPKPGAATLDKSVSNLSRVWCT